MCLSNISCPRFVGSSILHQTEEILEAAIAQPITMYTLLAGHVGGQFWWGRASHVHYTFLKRGKIIFFKVQQIYSIKKKGRYFINLFLGISTSIHFSENTAVWEFTPFSFCPWVWLGSTYTLVPGIKDIT